MNRLDALLWTPRAVPAALAALATRSGLRRGGFAGHPPVHGQAPERDGDAVEPWVASSAEALGLECEPVSVTHGTLSTFLRQGAPALLQVPSGASVGFLALLRGGRRKVVLVGADHRTVVVEIAEIETLLRRHADGAVRSSLAAMWRRAAGSSRGDTRAVERLLQSRLAETPIEGVWLLRHAPGSDFREQLRFQGVLRHLGLFLGAHAGFYAMWIFSWYMIGAGALSGTVDRGLLLAWALALLTQVAIHAFKLKQQRQIAVKTGMLLKRRILGGALALQPVNIQHLGIGKLLGRVFEADAIEGYGLGGGLAALLAVTNLAMATWVLVQGAGGIPHALLLCAWTLCLGAVAARRTLGLYKEWTVLRVQITELLFERMVGHRTRIVQQSPQHWHEDEDVSLARYLELSAKLDASYVSLTMAGQRGWLLVGLGGLLPTLLFEAPSAASIAVSLGGVILANQAFGGLAGSLWSLIAALVAWTGVAPLFRAAVPTGEVGRPLRFDLEGARKQTDISRPRGALLDVRELIAGHPRRSRSVLKGCGLQVQGGERILLSGASGAGKSTLAMVLLGLRAVDAGLLLFRGLDQKTLGTAGWRRQIALAPQFQDNFVFTGTLAFNLLMGREWPAGQKTLREAEAVCRELGLGELIDKMPLGLMTMVGRSGWQLSHGERSRVFIARSLLQRAPLTILDDSFATLDPENVVRALDTVLTRAPTLIVMAQR